jgi:WD40 repeat protein
VLRGHKDAIWDVALHPTISLVLTASADETIKLWDFGANGTVDKLALVETYSTHACARASWLIRAMNCRRRRVETHGALL